MRDSGQTCVGGSWSQDMPFPACRQHHYMGRWPRVAIIAAEQPLVPKVSRVGPNYLCHLPAPDLPVWRSTVSCCGHVVTPEGWAFRGTLSSTTQ